LVVILEIAVAPLALGLPLFALGFSIANAALLAYRVRVESAALAWAAGGGSPRPAAGNETLPMKQ
jgi:methyltransferase